MDVERLYKNVSTIDVVDIGYKILDDMSDFIADLNRKRLIEKGEDSNNNNIGEYSPFTKEVKDRFGVGPGSIIDHVTWYGKGNLHKTIFAGVITDKLIVDATDSKLPELEEYYNNKEVLGLTDSEIKIVKAEFEKRFNKEFSKAVYK